MSSDKIADSNDRLDAATHAANRAAASTPATQADRAAYAAGLAARFQAYVDWAIDNWPAGDAAHAGSGATLPDPAAFSRSREELESLLRQLGSDAATNADPSQPGAPQFVPVDPMPWP